MSGSVKKTQKNSKKKRNKIIAAALIAVGIISTVAVIIMAVCGVFDSGKVKPITSSREDRRVVGRIDGNKVRYEELKYVTCVLKEQYRERYGDGIWDSEESAAKYRDQLEADVIEALKEIYATVIACDEIGIKVNNQDAKDFTNAQIEDIVKKDFGGDFEAYKDYLARNNLTDAFMRFKTKTVYLDEQVKNKMIEEGHNALGYNIDNYQEFINYVLSSDDYSRIYYVIIEKSEDGAADKARDMASHLLSIEDEDERYQQMRTYIGRSTTMISTNGHYVVTGTMGDSFDSAVKSMDTYGVAVSETDDEYFVMMKMPKAEEHIKDGFGDMLAMYQEIAYTKYKTEIMGKVEFEGNKLYDSLDLISIVD